MSRGGTALLVVAAAALSCTTALAYTFLSAGGEPKRWPNARATMYHDPSWSGFPTFVSEWNAALGTWTAVAGSNFVFTDGGSSPSSNLRDHANGNSDVYFDTTLSPNTYAVTWAVGNNAVITDHDVIFNSNMPWATPANGTPGPPYDFRQVALHELGHVLGLGHETVVPAIMEPVSDAGLAKHRLEFDDEEGCRALYPAPTPPPVEPSGADLSLDAVSFTPGDAGSGDEIRIEYTTSNIGVADAPPFFATFYLTDGMQVRETDRFLGSRSHGGLAVGESRMGSATVQLPALPEPVTYRIGVILDRAERTGDIDRSNNSGVAEGFVRGGGDALRIGPGYRVTGSLTTFGRAAFVMDLLEGTRLRLDGSVGSGSLKLLLVREENGNVLAGKVRFRRVRHKVKIPATGTYFVYLESRIPERTDYSLTVGARPVKLTVDRDVGPAEQIFLPGYRGAVVDVLVKSRSDVRPTVELVGLDAPVKTNGKGTKIRLGSVLVEDTGPLVLVLSSAGGPSGAARYRVRMRFPKKGGPVVTR